MYLGVICKPMFLSVWGVGDPTSMQQRVEECLGETFGATFPKGGKDPWGEDQDSRVSLGKWNTLAVRIPVLSMSQNPISCTLGQTP